MSDKKKEKKSPGRRKTDCEKYNFQTVFTNACFNGGAKYTPIFRIISMPQRVGQDWKCFPPNVQRTDECFYIFIQNENYEKEGIINKVYVKDADISDIVIINSLNEAIDKFDTVTVLRLSFCNLTFEEIFLLQSILSKHPTITDLNIDGNPNSRQNFSILLKSTYLQYLSLQKCLINDRGIKHLTKELTESKILISLDLSSNSISDEGATLIANALRVNRCLVTLILTDNWIGDQGLGELMQVCRNFELRQSEIEIRRKINFEYEFKKLSLLERFRLDSLRRNKQSNASDISKRKMVKEKSNSTIISSRRRVNRSTITNQLESFMSLNLVKSDHPFVTDCVAENGVITCRGNLKLSYINLAFNKITPDGLGHITATLLYQNSLLLTKDMGLSNIVLNGNRLGESTSLDEIKNLLQEKILSSISILSRRKSSVKK